MVGVGPPNSAFSLILPSRAGVPQPRSPSPEHLSRLSVLGVPGEAETLLLPLTVLEGPLPVPSRLCPQCPQESLERTHQHPVLVEGASPHLQLHSHALGARVSPHHQLFCRVPWLCWQDFGVQGRPPFL